MRVLVIDAYARRQVQKVLDHALDEKHWYRPGKDARCPGDNPHFVAHLNTYRCVFSITETPVCPFRHLWISVPAASMFPSIVAAYTIAELFGFTGWDGKSADLPPTWMAHVSQTEHCIVLAQPYEKVQVPA